MFTACKPVNGCHKSIPRVQPLTFGTLFRQLLQDLWSGERSRWTEIGCGHDANHAPDTKNGSSFLRQYRWLGPKIFEFLLECGLYWFSENRSLAFEALARVEGLRRSLIRVSG
jgi:hypothetical protein